MPAASHYHIFSLPSNLLDTLTPRNIISEVRDVSPHRSQAPETVPTQALSGSRACNVCLGVTFTDVDEQRAHFRSDWHRYNVKVRLSGGNAVAETDFVHLVDSK